MKFGTITVHVKEECRKLKPQRVMIEFRSQGDHWHNNIKNLKKICKIILTYFFKTIVNRFQKRRRFPIGLLCDVMISYQLIIMLLISCLSTSL